MAIKFVQFVHPVAGGDGSIEYYSREAPRCAKIEVTEKGNWVHLVGKDGRRRRIPMTNVAYIEDDEEPKQ